MSVAATLLDEQLDCGHADATSRMSLQDQDPPVVVCGSCYARFQGFVHGFHSGALTTSAIKAQIVALGWSRRAARLFVSDLRRGGFECRAPGCTHYTPPRSLWRRIRSFTYGHA